MPSKACLAGFLTTMSQFTCKFLNLIKWPTTLVLLMLVPSTLLATWRMFGEFISTPGPIIPLLSGAGGYALLWKFFLCRKSWGFWFSTLEHELTHIIFVILTFNKVTDLRVTDDQGGYAGYAGHGNWLITISPYFFPLFSLGLVLILSISAPDKHLAISALLGITLSYNIIANYRQYMNPGNWDNQGKHSLTKAKADLHVIGKPLACTFIPAANLMIYSGILAYVFAGFQGMKNFYINIWGYTWDFILGIPTIFL
jgi:hypothetical protein